MTVTETFDFQIDYRKVTFILRGIHVPPIISRFLPNRYILPIQVTYNHGIGVYPYTSIRNYITYTHDLW
jgi:hypothetical protein